MSFGSSSSAIVVTAVLAALSMGAGLIIGYMLRPQPSIESRGTFAGALNHTLGRILENCGRQARTEASVRKYLLRKEVEACKAYTCSLPFPRHYLVYHLGDQRVTVDGRLDEQAWKEVAWTEPFLDIRGDQFAQPRFDTRVKVRWDDTHLYVGAYMEETDLWANLTLHDTTVYQDNGFQALFDTQQSNQKYKEITINALGTTSDMMLTRPYMDDGEPLTHWESDVDRAVHTDGPVNDPSQPNRFWSVEMAIPFKNLFAGVKRNNDFPSDREMWRANFVRPEWRTEVVGNKYHKRLDLDADWWVWTAPGVTNIHIPDRWGLLQFRRLPVNSTDFQPDPSDWVARNALLDIYRAMKEYKSIYGRYTDDTDLLELPPYILSKRCLRRVDLRLDWGGFRATVQASGPHQPEGHVRTDRFIWFGPEGADEY